MKEKKNLIGVEKHIRITDSEISDQIERIMELPEYKSFNKVITESLFYGVPMLYEKLFGKVRLEEATPYPLPTVNALEDKHFQVIIQLLKETVMNVVINKSILSSLFHATEKMNKVFGTDKDGQFADGLMSDTPDYLSDFENDFLKKMRR